MGAHAKSWCIKVSWHTTASIDNLRPSYVGPHTEVLDKAIPQLLMALRADMGTMVRLDNPQIHKTWRMAHDQTDAFLAVAGPSKVPDAKSGAELPPAYGGEKLI